MHTKEEDESAFLLDDYESEDDTSKHNFSDSSGGGMSTETRTLIEKLSETLPIDRGREDTEIEDELKIFYCSRTHSQLTQFIHELRRVKLPSAMQPSTGSDGEKKEIFEELKHLTLGSRKNLCINKKVAHLASLTAVNERCLDLQQSKTPVEKKCQYLPNKDNEALVYDFRDHAHARIRDIEDFQILGKKLGICPYYASRSAIKPSEIVTLPYPLLLQRSAREALKISMKNQVVIIDEAHNLMDTISGMYSINVSLKQLKDARIQLRVYLQKFRGRLKGKNRVYITQLVRVLDSLSSYLQLKDENKSAQDGQVETGDLMCGKGVDQVNLHKLVKYLHESKLARKVEGYAAFEEDQQKPKEPMIPSEGDNIRASVPVLTHLEGFLLALTYPAAEGRFFLSLPASNERKESEVLLKYLLLDPTQQFKEIVDEARAVILIGGTMSPMADYVNNLFPYISPDHIQTLSCGHVIPSSNLTAIPLSHGASGVEFNFTFEKRKTPVMIREVGLSVIQLCRKIPDGVVVFFPSHAYLDLVAQTWKTRHSGSTSSETLWEQLNALKRIFLEPSSTAKGTEPASKGPFARTDSKSAGASNNAESVLAAYTAHINSNLQPTSSPSPSGNGAILLAVINGSLSEGINFADHLGRAVIVVGLPFPNPHSAEWRAKVAFVERRSQHEGAQERAAVGREFYENACMRAVNQSIGRAIRHKGDYAAIVLMDGRYQRKGIRDKLPAWIQESLFVDGQRDFQGVIRGLEGFFVKRREAAQKVMVE